MIIWMRINAALFMMMVQTFHYMHSSLHVLALNNQHTAGDPIGFQR